MKKLFLLLLLSLSFTGSTYADAICNDGWKSTSEGSGTCSHHLGVCEWKPNYTYNVYSNDYNPSHNHGYNQCPSRGASDFYFNPLNVESSQGYGNTNLPMIMAYEGAYGMVSALGKLAGFQVQDEEGSAIDDISNAIAEAIANDKSSNTRSYYSSGSSNNNIPPNAYPSGSGWKCYGGFERYNNGCRKSNNSSSNNKYSAVTCIEGYIKTSDGCKEVKLAPENATANKQTTSSTLKSESKTTKKQTTLGFSGLSDLLGFLLLLAFLGLVFWWIFKQLKRLYKWLTSRRT